MFSIRPLKYKLKLPINISIFSYFIILFLSLLFVPSNNVYAAIVKPQNNLGLVGYWSFDEGAGTSATDFSGNGNHGTLTNMDSSTDWVNGKKGKALDFDGGDDGVYVNKPTLGASGFTISLWVKPSSSLGANDNFLGNWNSQGWLFRTYTVPGIIEFWNGAYSYKTTSSYLVSDVWQHIAVTYDTSGYYRLYYNGEVVYTSSAGQGVPTTGGSTSMSIGRLPSSTLYSFPGSIDEVRVYSRALSDTEIASLYTSGAQKVNSSQIKTNSSLDSGLVGYWPFNGQDISGTTAYDRSGQGNNGTLTNGPTQTIGRVGQALSFDGGGSADYVSTSLAPSGYSGITMATWVKLDSITSSYPMVMSYGTNANDVPELRFNASTGNMAFVRRSNNAGIVDPVNILGKGWYHFVGTSDGTTLKLYRDGELVSSYSGAHGLDSATPFFLGRRSDSVVYRFTGGMDETRVYNRVLSPDEVKQLYNLGNQKLNSPQNTTKSSLDSGLVGLWSFNGQDISGTTVYDRGSGGNNGTLTNGPLPTIGKVGQALSFDGVDDYVNLGSFNDVNVLSQMTISGWAKKNSLTTQGMLFNKQQVASQWIFMQFWTNQYMYISPAGTYAYGTVSTMPQNLDWNHYTMVFDGTKTGNSERLKFYINGEQQSISYFGTIPNTTAAPSANANIGYDTQNSKSFNGSIDEVRVYNRALSSDEVEKLYNLSK